MSRYSLLFPIVLVVIAIAQRRLGPSSSATTSTTDRALPSSAVQALLEPTQDHDPAALLSDSAACSAWSRHTMTVKNDGCCPRRPDTATG